MLKPLTTSEFTVKGSFHFVGEIVNETLYKQIDGVALGSPNALH